MSSNFGLLAILLQTTGDKFEDPVVHAVLSSLMDLEHEIPGSCAVLVGRLLHRLGRYELHSHCVRFLAFVHVQSLLCLMIHLFCSSEDSSLQSLNETAMSIFTKKPEPASESVGNKKLAGTPPLAAPTVSPLARFLITRLV